MREPTKNPFDLLLDAVRQVVQEEVTKALDKKKPVQRRLYKTGEVSAMLNLPESWLATKARNGEVPSRMFGKYRVFSEEDIQAIIERAAVKNGTESQK